MKLKKLLTPVLISFCVMGFSQVKTRSYLIDPKLAPREHNVDFTHLKLEVNFDPAKGLVMGKVTHRFIPLQPEVDSIVLDGINIRVKEILLNGKPAAYKNDSSHITVFPATKLSFGTADSMVITYEVNPLRGLYFVGWNDKNNLSRKQIWSQGQGTDNRCWIPMYDEMNDKLVSEVIATFDKAYKVLSNGHLVNKKENKDGTLTWHYSMTHPHSTYLIMLAIGDYEIKETKSKSGLPMHLYYYPEWKDRVESTYKYSEKMIDFYEKEIGVPFGWESYSQIPVQDYLFGAMENTTATVFGDFLFVDARGFLDRNYVGVNAHELAHQWFGDLVTARSDAHHWLQESFATYYDGLFEREFLGEDGFDWNRRGAQNMALDELKNNYYPVAHSQAGTVRHYPQGAFVLNMLKYVCGGREAYNRAIKYYLQKHKYENVDSHDLLIAFEETLGYSLDWFWDEWIYKSGAPDYQVNLNELDGATRFSIIQKQELTEVTGLPTQGKQSMSASEDPFVANSTSSYRPAGLFRMPIVFEVFYTDGSMDKKTVTIENQSEQVTVPNPGHKKVAFALFDPDDNVLKSVSFEKPFSMLEAQAMQAPELLDRVDALLAMKAVPPDTKRGLLLKMYDKEKFYAPKAEIIAQLANDHSPESMALMKRAVRDKDVMVRRAVLKEVNDAEVISGMLPDMELLLGDSCYEIVAGALEKLTALHPEKAAQYLDMTKNTEGIVGRNVLIKRLEIGYNSTSDKQYADKLVAFSGNSYEFRTRINALAALKHCNYFNTAAIENCIDAFLSSNTRLSGPAWETLNYFMSQDKIKMEITRVVDAGSWTDWQKKKLLPLRKS